MKALILGDTHLACKNGSLIFSKHQQKFFDNILFPYLEKNKYQIWQMGDLFDQRKFINFVGLDAAIRGFFDKIPSEVDMITLLGNHDISYKETLRVNAPELLVRNFPLYIVSYPQTIDGVDFIPWICDENRSEVQEFIKKSTSKIACGHFEIAGFSMQRGIPSHGGLDIKMFDKYKLVLSGHYHTRSSNCNITYVGTPYELTWSDYKDPKGFHVLDTETYEMEFIENPYTLFESFTYDDSVNARQYDIAEGQVFEKYIKVIVAHKSDYYKFDQFIAKLESYKPYDIKIIENFTDKPLGEIGEDIKLQDTLEVLDSYIESLKLEDSNTMKIYMKGLYAQANEVL